MNRKKKNIFLQLAKLSFLLLLFAIISCRKPVSYPVEPEIEYKSGEFTFSTDALGNNLLSFKLTLSFTDGDGNIGWAPSSDNPNAMRPCNVTNTHDLYINLYEKINGKFVKRVFNTDYYCDADTLKNRGVNSLDANLPYLVGQGQSEVLIGKISYDMVLPNLLSDTLMFDFQLSDREYNLSNLVESPELAVPSK